MTGAIIGAVVIGIGVLVGVLAWSRRGGRDMAVDQHRRHMDALSSDARREVIDRVRDNDDRRED